MKRSKKYKKTYMGAMLLAVMAWQSSAPTAARAGGPDALEPAPVSDPVLAGSIMHPEITEASGMAASRLRKDLLWIVNDGGNREFLYAVGTNGSDRGRVRVEHASNVDWEDLAAFRHNDEAFLVIGDFGDNQGVRDRSTVYIVREPPLKGRRFAEGLTVPWERRIRFVFAQGSFDCEGLGVDVQRQKILLLTKRTQPPVVYELSLFNAGQPDTVQVARRVAEIVHIPPPSPQDLSQDPRYGRFRSQPTALDISPDGLRAAILTYKNGYLYNRLAEESWTVAFARPPQLIVMPRLRQAEALCFDAGGHSLCVTSEKHPAPLYCLRLLPERQPGDR